MSKRKKNDLTMPDSWRSLKPSSSRKSSSRIIARRRLLIVGRIFCFIGVLTMGGLFYQNVFHGSHPNTVGQKDFTGRSLPVQGIVFRTDGALTQKWLANWLGPLRGLSLAEINLSKLHQNLVAEDQILSAQISRKFPATLEVFIKERDPLLVLRMRDNKLKYRDWLVSSDGFLYEGTGYSTASLRMLPSLKVGVDAIQKNSQSKGYKPLSEIPVVAPLLELARSEYPEIFRDWRVVSYNRPKDSDPGANITITSKRVGCIRFDPTDYAAQLKRLSYLLDETKFSQVPFINSIDLSHGRSVFAKI
jgi:hypothetical protein